MNIDNITLTVGNRNVEIDGISLIITDSNFNKNVSCRLMPTKTMPNGKSRIIPLPIKPLVLWSNEEYDNIGDYTQAQAEARALELLGPNIQEALLQNMMFR
jgi:hypothetical protein